MQVVIDLVILKPKNMKTQLPQHSLTFEIVRALFIMNWAINFQHQSSLVTNKVHNKSIKDHLSAKFVSIHSMST